ncbi:RHS repeat-associated core domain-containing protein [Acinetobacter halotolerans]|uniref:RHS repeat-associated core domain-containing protein n=1 Tax=Acinetobacter halotolerans TaxID=1752076 RepID=UPI001D1900C1|nr:RHS repeat-associated core domain-containing protein [Acinetobacter halotolerans]
MKNNISTLMQKTWLYTVHIVLLVLLLVFNQTSFAKDRIQYHVQNFDGSTIKVINEQGIVSQSYQYAPFGQQLQLKKPSNLKNPNAFVGGVQDAGDLVYLKHRHYNPVLGRFYQPDPITFLSGGHGQTNRYQYGWNDSYSYSDPSGATVTEAFGGLLAETWFAVTGQSYDYSNLKGALFNGYNGTGWELTTSFLSDCLNFCTLGVGSAAVNGIKLGINEVKILAASSKFTVPTLELYRPAYTYALVAERSGFYPVMKWGYKEPQAGIWLDAGDIWKIGVTIDTTKRYPISYLRNTGKGLELRPISKDFPKDAFIKESTWLKNYREVYGKVPPGNKGVK